MLLIKIQQKSTWFYTSTKMLKLFHDDRNKKKSCFNTNEHNKKRVEQQTSPEVNIPIIVKCTAKRLKSWITYNLKNNEGMHNSAKIIQIYKTEISYPYLISAQFQHHIQQPLKLEHL